VNEPSKGYTVYKVVLFRGSGVYDFLEHAVKLAGITVVPVVLVRFRAMDDNILDAQGLHLLHGERRFHAWRSVLTCPDVIREVHRSPIPQSGLERPANLLQIVPRVQAKPQPARREYSARRVVFRELLREPILRCRFDRDGPPTLPALHDVLVHLR
jgi:hypothetical protein